MALNLLKDNLLSIDSSIDLLRILLLFPTRVSSVVLTTTLPASGLILRQLKLGFIQVCRLYHDSLFYKTDINFFFFLISVNVPLRDYQFAITKTALFSNTLVALPTGLGKTLIAAVVMYNYFRWFPQGRTNPLLSPWLESALILCFAR